MEPYLMDDLFVEYGFAFYVKSPSCGSGVLKKQRRNEEI